MTGADAAKALSGLLEAERAALLSGDFAALPRLIPAKEEALSALGSAAAGSVEPGILEALRDRAGMNRSLLDAALRGVRAVQERLEAARNGGPPLGTYDARGRTEVLATAPRRVERRA